MNGFRAASLILGLACLWIALSALAAEPKRVYFFRPPAYVPDSDVITYRLRVPIHADNRKLVVAGYLDDDRVSYSEFSVDERYAFFDVRWRLPAGEVQLVAVLFSADREIARDTWKVTVYSWLTSRTF